MEPNTQRSNPKSDRHSFETIWESFAALIRKNLVAQAKREPLTLQAAQVILYNTSSYWESERARYGVWLAEYEQRLPEKAEEIRKVLFKDMEFHDVEVGSSMSESIETIIPTLVAIAILGVTGYFGFNVWQMAFLALAPAVALFFLIRSIRNYQEKKISKKRIVKYMEQLEPFKQSLLAVIG